MSKALKIIICIILYIIAFAIQISNIGKVEQGVYDIHFFNFITSLVPGSVMFAIISTFFGEKTKFLKNVFVIMSGVCLVGFVVLGIMCFINN
ncbi:MAG: hypothetical protein IJZ75_05910 [Clostridia bacterium]|nr:hypothetical protein [Clostridia bacterium]